MSKRTEKAVEAFLEGANCSQAVFTAFGDWTGLDEKAALTLSVGFGGGMGRTRGVCGAFSALVMLAGYLAGPQGEMPENRAQTYALVQQMKQAFEALNGSVICAELLNKPPRAEAPAPTPRTAEFYAQRPCARIVANACALLEGLAQALGKEGAAALGSAK